MDQLSMDCVGPGDAALLDDVAQGVFNGDLDPGLLRSYLASSSAILVVAREAGRVVGQVKAAVHLHPDKPADLYVDEIAVAPTHQRRGIARLLLREVERCARERNCADVWLATTTDNRPAQLLYGSFAASKDAVLYYWEL